MYIDETATILVAHTHLQTCKGRQRTTTSHWESVIDSRVRLVLQHGTLRALEAETTVSLRVPRERKPEMAELS